MARSPFTLAATVTAALPGAIVAGVAPLRGGGDGRCESAVALLDDGRRVVVRVPADSVVERELATEAIALQSLSSGVRAILPFDVPEFLGQASIGGTKAFVTSLLEGFQVEGANIPAGDGIAPSIGHALAALHELPASVVRQAGLPVRNVEEVRAELRRTIDDASATGHVPVRLIVRWRDAIDNDDFWRFEPAVTLHVQAGSFVFTDSEAGPATTGMLHWHALAVGDPAVDMHWLLTAPHAAEDVYAAYVTAARRAPDAFLRARARLHAELEFARWLLHGHMARDTTIVEDAAALLESLAEDVRYSALTEPVPRANVADALALLDDIPESRASAIDTSLHTDSYDPEQLGEVPSPLSATERWVAPPADEAEGTVVQETDPEPSTASPVAPAREDAYEALSTDEVGNVREEAPRVKAPAGDDTDSALRSAVENAARVEAWRAEAPPRPLPSRDGDDGEATEPVDLDTMDLAEVDRDLLPTQESDPAARQHGRADADAPSSSLRDEDDDVEADQARSIRAAFQRWMRSSSS